MRRKFSVRDIAVQAGLSEATVDRVLHERPGVRAATVEQVRRAVEDLERQRSQVRLTGRTVMFDVVMAAPRRFADAVRRALEVELPSLHPATVRARFHTSAGAGGDWVAAELERVLRTGSNGVVLQSPDLPVVREAVDALDRARVPVVTLASDLPGSSRRGYVGADNRGAGATAAYLLTQWVPDPTETVLVVRSLQPQDSERERWRGFEAALAQLEGSVRPVVDVVDDDRDPLVLEDAVARVLAGRPELRAVYSMCAGAGGNAAVVRAFERARTRPVAFVAHDLDGENADLLRHGELSAVLHHDLRSDCRHACRMLLQAPYTRSELVGRASPIQIVTPFNVPLDA
ncbi:LacI family DNA-binding transcriptional regulator [Kineococcus sp. SYSU DK001]|uniref:LacI family DNA-binding transcriptional regulator n=1 Tax=Kineococcus sp. SYSU DK001 TaxID=3383122 RepID=UPI003D7EEE05